MHASHAVRIMFSPTMTGPNGDSVKVIDDSMKTGEYGLVVGATVDGDLLIVLDSGTLQPIHDFCVVSVDPDNREADVRLYEWANAVADTPGELYEALDSYRYELAQYPRAYGGIL